MHNPRNAFMQSALWNPPDLCGVLEKQGRKRGDWKPRYFILKGSNLFWFATPTARAPKGVVPLEGAAVHTMRGPMLPEQHQYNDRAAPVMFGIVMVLDEAYAATAGGRPDLVMGASSPELQALWAKALQAASISRPELLAKLHQKISQPASSHSPKGSSRQPSYSVLSEGASVAGSHYQPTHDSPEKMQRALQRQQQQQQDAERQGSLARSLSDTGGLCSHSRSPSSRPRESFAFPTTGGSGSKSPHDPSSSMHEARLSQANVQQLQRQFEDGQHGRSARPSTTTTALEGNNCSPYRSRPRSVTPPRSPRNREPAAYSTLSGPTSAYPHSTSNSAPYGPPPPSPGKDQGRYPLRQMVRNLTDKVVGRVTPERRRGATPERLQRGAADYDMAAVAPWGQGAGRAVSPGAAAGTVGGRLVHGIMANWAGEDERPRGRQHRRMPPASPHRPVRCSPSPPCSNYGGTQYAGGSSNGSMRHARGDHGAGRAGGGAPASPVHSVNGLPLQRAPSPSSYSTHSSVVGRPQASMDGATHSGSPAHPLTLPLSSSSTPLHSPSRKGIRDSPAASTYGAPLSQEEELDQLSRQLRSAFMGLNNSCQAPGSEAGDSCVSERTEREALQLGSPQQAAKQMAGSGPLQQSELAAVQQQVSMAAQLLRAQADRLQAALGTSTMAMAGACSPPQPQPSRLPSEVTPRPSTDSFVDGQPHSGASTPTAAGRRDLSPQLLAHDTPEGGSTGSGAITRRRADTMFFMNQFQALQASLAEVAAVAAGAQQQQPTGDVGARDSVAQPRASMQLGQGPLQHYLNLVQQQLAKLQAQRANMEQDEANSLGCAMDAVQQALGALRNGTGGGGRMHGSASNPVSPQQQSRGPSRLGSGTDGAMAASIARAGSMYGQPPSPGSGSGAASRLGSSSAMDPAFGGGGHEFGGAMRPDMPNSMGGHGHGAAGMAAGGGSRAGSIRQASDNLRSQIMQLNPELHAQNQAQQQQVYASVQQQHQQQQAAANSRPGSMMSTGSDPGLASRSRQPSAMSMDPRSAAPAPYRPGSMMSTDSHPTIAAHARQPSTVDMANANPAAVHSRQPSTISMASNPAANRSRQPSWTSIASNPAAENYSRQPSMMSTGGAEPQGDLLPLPCLQDQASPTKHQPASVRPSAAETVASHHGPAPGGTASTKPSFQWGMQVPAKFFASQHDALLGPCNTSAPSMAQQQRQSSASQLSPGKVSSPSTVQQQQLSASSPRTVSTPVSPQLQLLPPGANSYPRTVSTPAPVRRVQELQQQPRARYSSTDWC